MENNQQNYKRKRNENEREKNDLNIKNFQKNMLDNGCKFRGEMSIENNTIEYEKQQKNPNSNLLLSPNHIQFH